MKQRLKYYLIPSIADIIFFSLLLALALLTPSKLLMDCDTGYHIRIGESILDTLSIPEYDLFSSTTPRLRYINFEWLSQAFMAFVHRISGLTGIVVFFSFLISFTYYLLFKILRKEKGNIAAVILITLLVITASSIHWLARPHIFSMIVLIIWYYILDLYQYKGKNHLYILPFIMLVWVNLHGAFLLGLILCGIYSLGNLIHFLLEKGPAKYTYKDKSKKLLLILLLSFFISFLNPNGIEGLIHPFLAILDKFMVNYIGEFASPDFHDPRLIPFEIFLLFMIIIFSFSKIRLNTIEILLMIVFTHFALYSARNVPLFAIIMAPVLLRHSEYILTEYHGKFIGFLKTRDKNISEIDMSTRGCFWLFLPFIPVIAVALGGTMEYQFDKKIKPVAAVEFLKKEDIKGRMFNEYEFGDYIIYSAYPQYRVFIDGRADMYGSEWLKEYCRIITLSPGWEKKLEKYNVNFIIFNTDSVLSEFLLISSEWHLIYSDKVANIFVKNTPENKYLIEKYKNITPAVIEDKYDKL
ncbi:MAG TPA: hypothetical protein PK874_11555 [Desulfobacteraceae bacterium]|nr:hypothetical protein [Desulfobacteraceae bacterium]HPJ68711.1 hypothetical protein [Desulfobacteraceae bacterium]HPQ28999.1 hypothetical protein [Desulfobacteraceae bacterium]